MSARILQEMAPESITAIIKNGELVSVSPEAAEDERLGKEAKNVLGYAAFQLNNLATYATHRRKVDAAQARAKLLSICRTRGRTPFTNDSVQAYMRELANTEESRSIQRRINTASMIASWGMIIFAAFIGAVVACVYTVFFSSGTFATLASAGRLAADFGIAFGVYWFIACVAWAAFYVYGYRPTKRAARNFVVKEWRNTEIKYYSKPIPRDVIALAVEIKKAIPNASIQVRSLEAKLPYMGRLNWPKLSNLKDYLLDPFLVVHLQGEERFEEYVVAVWDEPTFDPTQVSDAVS